MENGSYVCEIDFRTVILARGSQSPLIRPYSVSTSVTCAWANVTTAATMTNSLLTEKRIMTINFDVSVVVY